MQALVVPVQQVAEQGPRLLGGHGHEPHGAVAEQPQRGCRAALAAGVQAEVLDPQWQQPGQGVLAGVQMHQTVVIGEQVDAAAQLPGRLADLQGQVQRDAGERRPQVRGRLQHLVQGLPGTLEALCGPWAMRQQPGGAQMRFGRFAGATPRPVLQHPVQYLPLAEPVEREWFVLVQFRCPGRVQAQPFLQELAHRRAEEGGQLAQGDAALEVLRQREDGLRPFGHGPRRAVMMDGLGRRQPAPVVRGQAQGTGGRLRVGWLGCEVAQAEGVQRVFVHQHGAGRPVAGAVARVEVVEQFAHQHGGFQRLVAARVEAGVADDEAFARRQQGLEEQITVFQHRIGVAVAPVVAHVVEVVVPAAAREGGLLHAEQGDDAKWHPAQRLQGAEADAAAVEAATACLTGQGRLQEMAHHAGLELADAQCPGLLQLGNGLADALQAVLVLAVLGEQLGQQGIEPLGPLFRAGRGVELPAPAAQGIEQVEEARRAFGPQRPHVWRRGQFRCGGLVAAEGEAGQDAAHAVVPAVVVDGGQAVAGAVLRVQPPVHAQGVEQFGQLGEIGLLQPEAAADAWQVGKAQHLGAAEAAARQLEQVEEGAHQRVLLGLQGIGEVVGQVRRPLAAAAEHRLDGRGVAFDLRHHDEDVLGLQVRVLAQAVQQGVVQHLALPQGAVADMDLHRGQGRFRLGHGLGGVVVRRHGLVNIGLQAVQQGIAPGRPEVVAFLLQRHPVGQQQVLEGLTGAAPLGEKGVAHLPQCHLVFDRVALLRDVFCLEIGLAAPGGDVAGCLQVGPVFRRGGQQPQVHRPQAGQRREGLQQQLGQVVQREQVDARWQSVGRIVLQALQETVHQRHPVQLHAP